MPQDLSGQVLRMLLPWLILFGLVSILGAVLKAFLLPKIKGWFGETLVNRLLSGLSSDVYHRIANVMLPTPDGTTQIDHVVVSRYGIFVIETKTYKGWIFGGEKDELWTQKIFRRTSRFQNPLRQNYKHTKTLSDLTGIPLEYFKSIVAFSGECTFKTEMPPNVVKFSQLVPLIRSYQQPIIKDEQVPEVVQAINEWAGTVSRDQKAQHVRNLRKKRAPIAANGAPPPCPRCGELMVLRTSRKDNTRFWGCPKYPHCRGVREASEPSAES